MRRSITFALGSSKGKHQLAYHTVWFITAKRCRQRARIDKNRFAASLRLCIGHDPSGLCSHKVGMAVVDTFLSETSSYGRRALRANLVRSKSEASTDYTFSSLIRGPKALSSLIMASIMASCISLHLSSSSHPPISRSLKIRQGFAPSFLCHSSGSPKSDSIVSHWAAN